MSSDDLDELFAEGPAVGAGPSPTHPHRQDLVAFLVWLTDGHGLILMEGHGYRYHEMSGLEDINALLDRYEQEQAQR